MAEFLRNGATTIWDGVRNCRLCKFDKSGVLVTDVEYVIGKLKDLGYVPVAGSEAVVSSKATVDVEQSAPAEQTASTEQSKQRGRPKKAA